MPISDISGTPYAPEHDRRIVVLLPDGSRRELRASTSDVQRLQSDGTEVGHWTARAWHSVWQTAVVVPLLTLLVGSWIIPAIARQATDRQAALALKSSIISTISKGSVNVYGKMRDAVDDPLARLAETRDEALRDWMVVEGEIDGLYTIYFDDTSAEAQWRGFRQAIYNYAYMSCCVNNRSQTLHDLQAFLATHEAKTPPHKYDGDPWDVLLRGRDDDRSRYRDAYEWLGLEVLRRRTGLLAELGNASPAWHRDGRRWKDLVPRI